MITLVHGDCRDEMPKIAPASVSLVITSPPYNAGKEYESRDSLEKYMEFAESWVRLVPRLLTDNGSLWLNVGYMKIGTNETLPLTYLYHKIISLPLVQEIVGITREEWRTNDDSHIALKGGCGSAKIQTLPHLIWTLYVICLSTVL